MSTRLPLFALLTIMGAPASAVGAPAADCGWVDYDLKTGLYGPKQYWGDTNNAYAGTLVPSGPDYVYRFKGKFPNSRYMSIESAVFLDDGSIPGAAGQLQDVDDAIDHTIVPDAGSTNPFVEGASYPGSDNYFTVDAVPEGVDWDSPNQITIPADSDGSLKVVMIAFRAISPNMGVQIAEEDLPTVEALDRFTGEKVDCKWNGPVRTLGFYQLVEELFNNQAPSPDAGIDFADLLDLSEPSGLIDDLRIARGLLEVQYTTFQKWWPFRFRLVNIPFEGSAGVKGYLYGLTEMTPGNVAIIRFKAPSFLDTYSGEVENFTSRTDVRFWSMCATDFLASFALACMPDHMTQPDRFGYVTVVYGPDNGEVEAKANSLGYAFMADRREAEDWEGKVLSFIYRQLLPSPRFERFGLNRGGYVPTARVCSEWQFLRGWCSIP